MTSSFRSSEFNPFTHWWRLRWVLKRTLYHLFQPVDNSILSGASVESGEKSWGEFIAKNQSIVSSLFYGQLKSTVICLSCQETSSTFEVFSNVSLPLPSHDYCSLRVSDIGKLNSQMKLKIEKVGITWSEFIRNTLRLDCLIDLIFFFSPGNWTRYNAVQMWYTLGYAERWLAWYKK